MRTYPIISCRYFLFFVNRKQFLNAISEVETLSRDSFYHFREWNRFKHEKRSVRVLLCCFLVLIIFLCQYLSVSVETASKTFYDTRQLSGSICICRTRLQKQQASKQISGYYYLVALSYIIIYLLLAYKKQKDVQHCSRR